MFRERTALQITPSIRDFAVELECGEPTYIPIIPGNGFGIDFECLPGQCHLNTAVASKQMGGEPVFGWSIWENTNGDWLMAEFHSVWKTPQSELIDVTPDLDGETCRLFCIDPVRTFDGRCIPSRYKVLTKKRNVVRAVHLLNRANDIQCRYRSFEKVSKTDTAAIMRMRSEA